MSLIDIAPQKPKEYDNRKQDHGDAAMERELAKRRDDRADPYDLRGRKRKDEEHLRTELAHRDDFTDITPEALEAAADEILGESHTEEPALLKASQDILSKITNPSDEAVVGDLLDEYRSLIAERLELLEDIETVDAETATDRALQARAIEDRAEAIEEEIMETLSYQDGFPTEAELGLKSKREIGKEMARRVTLDIAYDEDDTGDSDYSVPVHIKNRL